MFDRADKPSFDKGWPNKNHKADIRYTFQMCQWLLKPIGMWMPIYGFATIADKVISLILRIVCFCLLCFVLIPCSHHAFFREQRITVKLQEISGIVYCLTSTIKYFYLRLKAVNFGECIKHVENDWRMVDDPQHRSIMLKKVAVGRHLTIICVMFLYIGGTSYCAVLPLLSKKTFGNITSRNLVYKGYDIFFDVTASPAYEICLCLHCFYTFTICHITAADCNLAAIFITHACGQIQIQMQRLENLVQLHRTQSSQCEDPLTIIVKSHIRVLRFSGYVEDVLREVLLLELVSATILICLVEYCCIVEWADSNMVGILTYCMVLGSVAFNMLIFCYIGELLVDQGAQIGEACYAIEWYNLPRKKARPLLFVMMMSKFPPKLTAGKMFDLSLATFSTILKTSVAYLNLIRAVAE